MRRYAGISALIGLLVIIVLATPAAQPQAEDGDPRPPANLSRGQRELGLVILEDFSVKAGTLSFRTATGGCTDRNSFQATALPGTGLLENVPHYVITVTRIKRDDCKGMFREGVVIEFDIEKDLGLKGLYTFAIANPMFPIPVEHF